MKVAIMQPYFFPYLGYMQLVSAVDKFVFFDDVNFIKKGWIHRNRIRDKAGEVAFSVPLRKASQNNLIKDQALSDSYADWTSGWLKTLTHCYQKAPRYEEALGLVKKVLSPPIDSISDLAQRSVESVCAYTNLTTEFTRSSDLQYDRTGSGQDKILSICQNLGATSYFNPFNGRELYDPGVFSNAGIELYFMPQTNVNYLQFSSEDFIPNLSVIDALMFVEVEELANFINA